MCRAYGTPILVEVTNNGLKSVVKICSEPMALVSTANLVLIPNSIKNNLKDVCIDKGLKPACPVGRPVAIDDKILRDFSPKHKAVVHLGFN